MLSNKIFAPIAACNADNAEEMDKFFCASEGKCISSVWRCDDSHDCAQGEDEDGCGMYPA